MSKALEIELKLDVDAAGLRLVAESLAAMGGEDSMSRLAAVYFDTPDRALYAMGVTLRVRNDAGHWVQTLKAGAGGAAGLLVRDEWEWPVDGDALLLAVLAEPLAALGFEIDAATLEPQFSVAVTRRRFVLRDNDAEIEIACDAGEAVAGKLRAQISELELELKSGSRTSLFRLARRLDDVAPLRLGVLAKADRGFLLLAGQAPASVKAAALALRADMTIAAALQAAAQNCLVQFRRNEVLLMRTGDADAVHQTRVGLRRLRTALRLFEQAFPKDQRIERLRADLRQVTQHIATVRNLDVLIGRNVAPGIMQVLLSARTAELARSRVSLASRPVRRTMLGVAEWLATGPDMHGSDADARILAFAVNRLDRLRSRLLKAGTHFSALDDTGRHRLRIRAKHLRYTSEFFRSVIIGLGAGKRKGNKLFMAFMRPLAALQGHLGELNDRAVAPGVLVAIGFVEGIAPVAASFEARAASLAGAEAALSALAEAQPFWAAGKH
jgi:triphosphatase